MDTPPRVASPLPLCCPLVQLHGHSASWDAFPCHFGRSYDGPVITLGPWNNRSSQQGPRVTLVTKGEREMEESLFNRREVLTGSIIAALGALRLPSTADAATTPTVIPPPGAEGATLVFDVACLGQTWA